MERLAKRKFCALRRGRKEHGHVVVWAAIIFPVMLGIASFAVDLGNIYLHAQRLQRAADAAALAGDPSLPGNLGEAQAIARDTLKRNKLSDAEVASAVIQQDPDVPTALRVEVSRTVNNNFITVLGGSKTQKITRDATADHADGLRLGNGSNLLGGYEFGTDRWSAFNWFTGGYYLQIASPNGQKVDGDRISGASCNLTYAPGYAPLGVYGCSGNTNLERDARGYTYRINIAEQPGGGTSRLVLQSYDPGFANAGGDGCDAEPAKAVNVPMYEYGAGCTGEASWEDGYWDTNFGLYESATSTSPLARCSSYPSTYNASASLADPRFDWIHKWVTVCDPITVDLSKTTTYFLRVWSTGSGNGTNGFALRAGLSASGDAAGVNPTLSQQAITLEGDVHMGTFNNFVDAGNTFSLTQVSKRWAGSPIKFQFFDLGDNRNKATRAYMPATMSLIQDNGQAVPGTCLATNPGGMPRAAPNCSITIGGGSGSFQGQLLEFTWQVPPGYSCEPTSKTFSGGCYVYAKIDYAPGTNVTDNSTWSLDEPSRPLRLIE